MSPAARQAADERGDSLEGELVGAQIAAENAAAELKSAKATAAELRSQLEAAAASDGNGSAEELAAAVEEKEAELLQVGDLKHMNNSNRHCFVRCSSLSSGFVSFPFWLHLQHA
jgi:multidrug resistance efflux pump